MKVCTATWGPSTGWSGPLPAWDGPRTLVMAFGAQPFIADPAPFASLAATYPNSVLVGCSTAGEIFGDAVRVDSISAAIVSFDTTRIKAVHDRVDHADQSYDVGLRLAKQAVNWDPEVRMLFVLSDGLRVNGSALVAGLSDGAAGVAIISGGLAGDGDRFARTWTLIDGEPHSGFVTVVGFAGPDLNVGHGSRGGWAIFGPERRVTRSDGNVLYELDGQPALQLYKTYLGERAAGLPATALLFPLAVRVPGPDKRQIVRTILGIDEKEQSMTFAGDVPQGSLAQLMHANLDRLIDGAHIAAAEAAPDPGSGALAIAVSCVGRRLLLGRRTEDEIEATRDALPSDTELVGFYSYGEMATIAAGACDLHNETMTITTLWESA